MFARMLLLCLLLGTGCQEGSDAEPGITTDVQAAGELSWDGKLLSYTSSVEDAVVIAVEEPWPYQLVSSGPPALVTVLGDGLELTTWAAGEGGELTSYAGWMPAVSSPPLSMLTTLPRGEADTYQGIKLLGEDGQVIWEHHNAALLSPAWGELEGGQVLVATAERGDIFTPFGDRLRISLLNPATEKVIWDMDPGAQYAVAGIELWVAEGQFGLLALQYGQEQYEFLSIDLTQGARVDAYKLSGQPFYGLIYPGMFDEPIVETDTDGAPAVRVFHLGQEPRYLRLDATTGGLSASDELPLLPQPIREENPLSLGGTLIPGPGAMPFPINIFPTDDRAAWRTPALVDGNGNVLVISTAGASWEPI